MIGFYHFDYSFSETHLQFIVIVVEFNRNVKHLRIAPNM